MTITKSYCDRCETEIIYPVKRELYLSGLGREGGFDLCNSCYTELFTWFREKHKKNKGVLDQINEKQDSLRTTCKAWEQEGKDGQ